MSFPLETFTVAQCYDVDQQKESTLDWRVCCLITWRGSMVSSGKVVQSYPLYVKVLTIYKQVSRRLLVISKNLNASITPYCPMSKENTQNKHKTHYFCLYFERINTSEEPTINKMKQKFKCKGINEVSSMKRHLFM